MKPKTDIKDGLLRKLKEGPDTPSPDRPLQQIIDPIPTEKVLAELKKTEILVDSTPEKPEKGFLVFRASGRQIPNTLLEIGRLREITFRSVGEGTGLSHDNDQFDLDYEHFICWDKKIREITGAYRVGRVDLILKEKGPKGVYTNTLFNLEHLLGKDFREGTLEAGRSFVRTEFQRGLTLLFIWMALARYISANPQYKYLMGPVSISNEFQENSKHLMVSYLMKYHEHEKSFMVSSKNPPKFDSNLEPAELTALIDQSINLASLQEFVREAEGDERAQIPQLIKLYLELGVRFLAFYKDDDFNSIDGLIWLDIRKMPDEIGHRYFGAEAWAKYKAFHSTDKT
jgi:putative hemolysin